MIEFRPQHQLGLALKPERGSVLKTKKTLYCRRCGKDVQTKNFQGLESVVLVCCTKCGNALLILLKGEGEYEKEP